jgi:HEAT repeat protein
MTKHFPILAGAAVAAALLCAATVSASETPTERAWLFLQQGLTSKRAAKRANAAHALRLIVDNPRAQEMAERALTDPDPKVRAAAARALGPMAAASAAPRLKGLLTDREPFVVLAAAHSLFLLGDRDEVYDIDC